MNAKIVGFIGVVALLLLTVGVILVMRDGENNTVVEFDDITSPDDSVVSPLPQEETTYQGEVTDISDEPVGYKNSLLLTVLGTDGTSTVIYLPEGVVVEGTEEVLTREDIATGDEVTVVGVPIEGGVEATEVRVVEAMEVTVTEEETIQTTPPVTASPTP